MAELVKKLEAIEKTATLARAPVVGAVAARVMVLLAALTVTVLLAVRLL